MDGLFSSILPDGEIFYGFFWQTFFDRLFSWNFPYFWGSALLIGLLACRFDWRGPVFPKWAKCLRSLAIALPIALFLWFTCMETGNTPHLEDEITNLYQARIISTGTYPGIIVPIELKNTFQTGFLRIASNGRLLGIYPPGFPIILAALDLVSLLPWAQFILLVVNLWVMYWLFSKFFSSRRVLPWLLLSTSPLFEHHSVFLFSQSLSLLLVNLVWLRRIQQKPFGTDYLLCSFLFLARPLDGLLLVSAIFCWQIHQQGRFPRESSGFLTFIPLYLLNQKIQTGAWFASTYHLVQPFFSLGYGTNIGIAIPFGFNLFQAIDNLSLILLAFNETLLGWPAASLIPVILFYWIGSRKGWLQRPGMGFAALLTLFWFFGYFNLFHSGLLIGPRYHQPLVAVLLVQSCVFIFSRRYWRPVVLMFCLVGFWNLFCHPLRDFAGVLSFPEKEFSLLKDRVYVVPDLPLGGKDLYRSFFSLNDLFHIETLRFINERDFCEHPEFFRARFGERLASFPWQPHRLERMNSP